MDATRFEIALYYVTMPRPVTYVVEDLNTPEAVLTEARSLSEHGLLDNLEKPACVVAYGGRGKLSWPLGMFAAGRPITSEEYLQIQFTKLGV